MGRLKDLTEFLIKTPGRRKAMLLVSEAIGFDATDFKDYRGTAMKPAAHLAHAAMTAATRGNIAIYPIHPGGARTTGGRTGIEKLSTPRWSCGPSPKRPAVSRSSIPTSSTTGFTRLVEENSVYYMLGFNSGQDKDNGLLRAGHGAT